MYVLRAAPTRFSSPSVTPVTRGRVQSSKCYPPPPSISQSLLAQAVMEGAQGLAGRGSSMLLLVDLFAFYLSFVSMSSVLLASPPTN